MPKYAEDLTNYLERIGDGVPQEALDDPDFLARCVSREAPIALVGKVAEGLENLDEHPAIKALTDYERGRVMTILGRNEEAVELYNSALAASPDPETKGNIAMNLALILEDKTEVERLLREVVREGHSEAKVILGQFLYNAGEVDEAVELLKEGISEGVEIGVPILVDMYGEKLSPEEYMEAMEDLVGMAKAAGIQNPNDGFKQLYSQSVAWNPDGRVRNITGMMAPLRVMVSRMFND